MTRRMPKIAMAAAGMMIVARLGLMTADAATDADETVTAAAEAAGEEAAAAPTPAEAILSPDQPEPPRGDGVAEMLALVAAERRALEDRRTALEAKEADLLLVEEGLRRQRIELIALKDELGRILEAADLGDDNDLARLVKMYGAMKPKEAGAIMADMDLEVATMVIAAMRERDAGPILANMPAPRAQTISRIIYERSKLPGDQRPVVLPAGG